MPRFSTLIVTAFALVALTTTPASADCGGCDADSETCAPCGANAETANAPYTLRLGLAGYSPVSYLDDHRAEPGSPRFQATHNGVTYFFASDQQRETFNGDPDRFLPAYGGYCAYGCAVEGRFIPNPNSFKIIGGRTHLFLLDEEADTKELWEQGDERELIAKADTFWNRPAKPVVEPSE